MAELTIGEIGRLLWAYGLPVFMFAFWAYALQQGWWVHRRELQAAEGRCAKVEAERDEMKQMLFKLVGIGERLSQSVEAAVKR